VSIGFELKSVSEKKIEDALGIKKNPESRFVEL